MNKPESILTDAEMHALICGNPSTLGLSIARLKDFIHQVEKAVVAKQSVEQQPIGYLHANEISFLSAKGITAEQARADDYNTPLYTHPMPCLSQTQDKTAADMYWINPDYPSYESVLDAFEPISSSVEIKVGDRYEVSSAKMLPMMTVEVSELEENGDVKAYKVLGSEHAPDAGKIINLSLSIDTKEVQTLLQSYLDTLDGWQLVPVEPIEEMLKKAFSEIFDIDGISKNDLIERYQAMLAAAPKFGDKQ